MKIFSLNRSYLEPILSNLGEKCYIFPYISEKDNCNQSKLVEKFKLRQPDIFLFHKAPHVSKSLLQNCKKVSPRTKFVMIMWDLRGGVHPLVYERKEYIDLLLVNNNDIYHHQLNKNIGIPEIKSYYDSICSSQFYSIDQNRKYDLFFGGNNFKKYPFPLSKLRYELITKLYRKFNLVVHGRGWDFQTRKIVRKKEYNLALNTAKINIGINHYNAIQYYEERFFENIGSGRLHMTYYIPGMEKHFKNHKHLVWFKSIEECCELAEHYIKHDDEREKIAKCGRDLLLQNHTHKHRAIELQKYFKEMLNT